MAGNELKVVKYLLRYLGELNIDHIGPVTSIGAPNKDQPGYVQLNNECDLPLISTSDNKKKADVYINGYGVSVKQEGGSFGFNRLQRKSLESVFRLLSFNNIPDKINRFDREVTKFHQSSEEKRNIDWSIFFTEEEFYHLTELLMTRYSPKYGFTKHPADLILIAAKDIKAHTDLTVLDFKEYFNFKKDNLKIAIRRSWIGQDSKSEHGRAISMAKAPENSPWVFEVVSGVPRSGWNPCVPERDRKTVYYVMIEDVKKKEERKIGKKVNVLSLFCGAGGLDLGFELAGLEAVIGSENALEAFKDKDLFNSTRYRSIFHTVYANDICPETLESYRENMPSHIYIDQNDICNVKEFPRANIVLGGFPCPVYSTSGNIPMDDNRNNLFYEYLRSINQVKPEIFVAENVKGLLSSGHGELLKKIIHAFTDLGYKVKVQLLNARDYGVPQIRERVFIIGVRSDIDFEYRFPEPTHEEFGQSFKTYVTLEEAIGDLRGNPGPFYKMKLFKTKNGKLSWNEQSSTILASGINTPIHPDGPPLEKVGPNDWIIPEGNRRLSIKEISRIQTFPDWYYFSNGNRSLDKVYKQIGSAVPVLLASAVAKPIAEWAINYSK